jgi:hypothetical protein
MAAPLEPADVGEGGARELQEAEQAVIKQRRQQPEKKSENLWYTMLCIIPPHQSSKIDLGRINIYKVDDQ